MYNRDADASWERRLIMSFNGKHLSLEDRKIIEENINKGLRKFETAKELNKSQSTIGKAIKNNRKRRYSQVEDVPRKCKYYNECKVCIGMCSNFEEVPCLKRDKFVGACNSCSEIKHCKKTKYFYYANIAQKKYEYSLKDSRQGVNLNTTELYDLSLKAT